MQVNLITSMSRALTWYRIVLLAVLSLWPGRGLGFLLVMPELNTLRTGLPGQFEHFIAYAGSAAVAMPGYGASRGSMQIIGAYWIYAGILEYLQHFSPG